MSTDQPYPEIVAKCCENVRRTLEKRPDAPVADWLRQALLRMPADEGSRFGVYFTEQMGTWLLSEVLKQ